MRQTLDLYKQRDSARTDQDKKHVKRLIEATDREIEQLFNELYDFTQEEIAIAEAELEWDGTPAGQTILCSTIVKSSPTPLPQLSTPHVD